MAPDVRNARAIATARDAAELFEPMLSNLRTEALLVAYVDADRQLIRMAWMAEGGRGEVALPVAAILAEALRLNARGILIAHNHPSGDARPGDEDREATRALAEAAGQLGIRLHDHLVFGDGRCSSFRALGLL